MTAISASHFPTRSDRMSTKSRPRGDIVDVEEDAVVSELVRQPIVDQPSEAGRVFPPVADEDAAQHVDALAARL